jgi:transcriptional regulator with XRE-family HTH domain
MQGEFMNFWDRLRAEIKERDLTQEDVAKKLNVPIGTFKNWLLRQTYPDALEIVEIAKMLDTSAEYLVTGTDSAGLSEEERHLIKSFRKLSKCEKDHVVIAVDAWIQKCGHNS